MTTPEAPKIHCEMCSSTFTRHSSLLRHMERKHAIDDTIDIIQNTKNKGNITNNTGNTTNNTGKHDGIAGCNNLCDMCNKEFTRTWYLRKHLDCCRGVKNPLQCEYCKKHFLHKDSRFKHYKVCKTKKEIDSMALVPVADPSDVVQPTTINNNIETQNIQTQQNIQNQNNNQNVIIVYNPGSTEFKTDHLKADDLQKILQLATPFVNSNAVREYTRQIMSHPENQCIKKEDLKSGHSEVHLGDNQWELELDRDIYPKLASNMANSMSDFLYTKRDQLRREMFDKLTKFVDHMADEGYINTDDAEKHKEMKKEYKTFVKGLKLIVFGATRARK